MGKVVELPFPEFPEGTRLYDVEGVPVVLKHDWVSVAFDPGPRWFPLTSVFHNGTEVSEGDFRRAVEAAKANPNRPWHGGWPREWPHSGPRRDPRERPC